MRNGREAPSEAKPKVPAYIVTFSDMGEEKISIPLIEIEVSKWYAVELLTVLCSACFYRLLTLLAYESSLERHLVGLLKNRGYEHSVEYLEYPSIVAFLNIFGHESRAGKYSIYLIGIPLILAGVLVPVICGVVTLINHSFTLDWFISSVITVLFLIAATLSGLAAAMKPERLL